MVYSFCYSYSNAQITTIPIQGTNLSITVDANGTPLQNIQNLEGSQRVVVTGEDSAPTQVPLNHTFPYFGQTFDTSWMSENGVVTFKDPGSYTFCCNGLPINTLNSSFFDYTIFPLWTDWTLRNGGELYTNTNNQQTTYGWYGVSEWGSNNKTNFELTIKADGTFQTRMEGATVFRNPVTSGFTGSVERGERYQVFHKTFDGIENRTQSWSVGVFDPTLPNFVNEQEKRRFISVSENEVLEPQLENPVTVDLDFLSRITQQQTTGDDEREEKRKDKTDEETLNENDKTFLDLATQRSMMNGLVSNLNTYTGVKIPDAEFYVDHGIYRNQRVVDNLRLERGLNSGGLHKQMVDEQWNQK